MMRILIKLLMILLRKPILEELEKTYDMGLKKGYELGYKMGQAERTNRGFIIGSDLDKELEDILKRRNDDLPKV